jgi:hypothetical protein
MNTRTAPIYRALCGMSLALLCGSLGQQFAPDAPAPTPTEPTASADSAAAADSTVALASRTTPGSRSVEPPSTFPIASPCTDHCGILPAGSDLSWGVTDHRVAPVSAPPMEEPPPARGPDVAIAYAQAAVQQPTAEPHAGEPFSFASPRVPVVPARPGGLSLDPIVLALLETETVPTDDTADAVPLTAATDPRGETPDAHAAPDLLDPSSSYPSADSGAPFKRGSQPSEKPGARSAAPLPYGQAPNAHGPAMGPGSADPAGGGAPTVSLDLPHQAENPWSDKTPGDVPDWMAPVLNPGGDPGPAVAGPQIGGPAPLLPLFNDTEPLVERIASGTPGPGEDPFRAPRLESAARPTDLLVAAAVPEPTSLLLFAIASFSMAGLGRARRH